MPTVLITLVDDNQLSNLPDFRLSGAAMPISPMENINLKLSPDVTIAVFNTGITTIRLCNHPLTVEEMVAMRLLE